MEAADPRRAPSTVGLVDVLEDYWEHMERLWELHFEIVFPAYVAVSEFADLYRDLFGGEAFDAYRLLQGSPTRTFEVGCDLWRLSRLALRSPGVADVLATHAAADVPAALEALPAGREVLTQLDRHLAAFGHRTASWGLATPSFIEDPTPVLKMLKDYVTQPDSASPGIELERQVRERDAAVAEARERLAGYPAPVVEQFEALLEAAQTGLLLTEDHGFYIDAYAVSLVRELLSEMGDRLVADGVLDDREDVLMLRYDDLRVAALDLPGTDPRTLVEQRRATLAEHAGVTPPPVLGTIPAGPPPPSPLIGMAMKFSGSAGAVERPRSRHRRGRLGRARHRRRPRRPLARRGGRARAGRGPRRRDDRAAVDAAVRHRRRGRHRHRRHPQPLGGRRPRVRDPGGRRGRQRDGRDPRRRPRRGRRRRGHRADRALTRGRRPRPRQRSSRRGGGDLDRVVAVVVVLFADLPVPNREDHAALGAHLGAGGERPASIASTPVHVARVTTRSPATTCSWTSRRFSLSSARLCTKAAWVSASADRGRAAVEAAREERAAVADEPARAPRPAAGRRRDARPARGPRGPRDGRGGARPARPSAGLSAPRGQSIVRTALPANRRSVSPSSPSFSRSQLSRKPISTSRRPAATRSRSMRRCAPASASWRAEK